MYPNSTRKGVAVPVFPDVCHSPTAGAGAPVAAPFPNAVRNAQTTQGRVTIVQSSSQLAPGSIFGSVGDQAQSKGLSSAVNLRGQLSQLHGRLASLSGSDPNQWHALIDEYVQVTAQLYVTLASSKKTDP
jgi:hypothetical protein